jgi:hypothetical protein
LRCITERRIEVAKLRPIQSKITSIATNTRNNGAGSLATPSFAFVKVLLLEEQKQLARFISFAGNACKDWSAEHDFVKATDGSDTVWVRTGKRMNPKRNNLA